MGVTPDQAAMGAYNAYLDREEDELAEDLWAAEEAAIELLEDQRRDERAWEDES